MIVVFWIVMNLINLIILGVNTYGLISEAKLIYLIGVSASMISLSIGYLNMERIMKNESN